MSAIKHQGYFLIGGKFGRAYYTGDAKSKKLDDGTTINYWTKDQVNLEGLTGKSMLHAVVLLGASKASFSGQAADMIYYVDPSFDLTRPTLPIYALSYKSFCERVRGCDGKHSQHSQTYLLSHPTHAHLLDSMATVAGATASATPAAAEAAASTETAFRSTLTATTDAATTPATTKEITGAP